MFDWLAGEQGPEYWDEGIQEEPQEMQLGDQPHSPKSFPEIKGIWGNIAGNPASPALVEITARAWEN